jgi:VWFA-related protein
VEPHGTRGGRRRLRCRARAAAVLVLGLCAETAAADEDPVVRDSELVERAGRRLTQIDVTVEGDAQVRATLTARDFSVRVNLEKIEDFAVDCHCPPPSPSGSAAAAASATYLFYFDQPHLTFSGRRRALELAREIVPRLIRDGHRGMIVSNAGRLAVVADLTGDAAALLAALDRLENDPGQWDFFAEEEQARIGRLIQVLDREDVQRAMSVAHGFSREEAWRSDQALHRLELTLARMADIPTPKAVVYFADTLRSNAGEHYLEFFGLALQRTRTELAGIAAGSQTAVLAFDRVVNQAATQGLRFYAVLAQGLITPFDESSPSADTLTRTKTVPASAWVRHRHTQDSLANLATETGGRAFLRGESAGRIAERVGGDLACLYVISLESDKLPEDAPLKVFVEVRREGVTSRSRGRVVLQSASTRLAARLLSAFSLEGAADDATELRVHAVPTGFRDGEYTALLQLSVPGTMLSAARWDLGASLLHREQVRQQVSGVLSVDARGVPLVLEREVRLRPGPHEIVAVAHETTTDLILSRRLQVDWPDPDRRSATCGPIVLLQPATAAFARGVHTRTEGSLAHADADPVETALPTALIQLVCRGRREQRSLAVERSLTGGETRTDFERIEVDLGDDRCVQVRDLISAGSLTPGSYRYEVRVLAGDETIDRASRELLFVNRAR